MFKRVMVLLDGKPASQAAVRDGTALAAIHGSEILFLALMAPYTLPVADAAPFINVPPETFLQAARDQAEQWLAAATRHAEQAGVMAHSAISQDGDDAHAVAEVAKRRRCDLIVVASDGHNAVVRLLTGNVIPGLITVAPVPVLVCKPTAEDLQVPPAEAGVEGAA